MKRKNCWEVNKCGRQPGGKNAEKQGICPAALPGEFDGVNGGERSGRCCWAVAGTFCTKKVKGTSARKLMNCINCDFFKRVNEEEGRNFVLLAKKGKKLK